MAIKEKTALSRKVKGKNSLLLLLIILTFASCSQVRIHSAATRFISPEATGKTLSGEIEVQVQSGTEATITLESNEINKPMKLRNDVTPIGTGLNLGLLERVDFIGYGRTNGAPLYGVKVQLIGDPKAQAKKGNFSAAITAGMGSAESKFSKSELFSSEDTEASVSQSIKDYSVIVGYRTEDDVVLYLSAQMTNHKVDLSLESTEASLDGKKINLLSDNLGLSVGAIRYEGSFVIKLEASAQQTNWTNNEQTTFGVAGVSVGRHW